MEKKICFRPPPPNYAPWLVYTHGNFQNQQSQTFCTISPLPPNNNSFIKSIPELCGKSIVNCCHGWLILRDLDYSNIFSLFNPVTLESLHLPPLLDAYVDNEDTSSCILTRPPNENLDNDADDHTKTCMFLLFLAGVAFSCRPRSSYPIWVRHIIELEGERATIGGPPIMHNGILYGWAILEANNESCLVSIEVIDDDDDFSSNSITLKSLRLSPPSPKSAAPWRRHFWLESCGQIYCVFIVRLNDLCNRVNELGVFELDMHKREWVEVKSLNGRAFFLGVECCTWCWGTSTYHNPELGDYVEGDCVYFFMSTQDVKSLYSYRLYDQILTVLCPCPNLVTPHNSPVWVTPQYPRSLAEQEWNKTMIYVPYQAIPFEYKELFEQNETLEIPLPKNRKKEVQESLLTALPSHLTELITEHINIFDYRNFHTSCKKFHAAFPPVLEWRTTNWVPLFIYLKNGDGSCQIMDPFRNDSRSSILHLSPNWLSIEFSKDGWLIILNSEKSLQFFNPFTRMRIDLPPCESMYMLFTSIGFSTRPDCPNCLTVGIIDLFDQVIVYYLEAANDAWKCSLLNNGLFEFQSGYSSPIYYDGAFYFLGSNGYLGVFELVNGKPSWQVHDKPPGIESGSTFQENHLVQCGGVLHSVFIGNIGKWVQLFKFNKSEKKWIKVDMLGDYCLFIGRPSSFSIVAKDSKMRNRIYLSRVKGNAIVYYCLETTKFYVSGSQNSMENLYYTMEPLCFFWL